MCSRRYENGTHFEMDFAGSRLLVERNDDKGVTDKARYDAWSAAQIKACVYGK